MMEGYAEALNIAVEEDSAYAGCIKALAEGDIQKAQRQADEFYLQLLTKGGGAGPALNWKNAWEAAVQEAMAEGN